MKKEQYLALIRTLFAGLSNRLFLSHTALEQLRTNENLTPAGLLNLKTIGLCHRHMNHLCNLIDYLTSDEKSDPSDVPEYFDSEDLLSGITKTFSDTITGYFPITASFIPKLKSPQTIRISKTRFETVFLNILYSCLKTTDFSQNQRTKLTLSVSETKQYVTFHIRTNHSSSASEMIDKVFSDTTGYTSDLYSHDAVLALSLKIASAFVDEAHGNLSYKALKCGSRYDISLPKPEVSSDYMLHSPNTYVPSYDLFEETFAELKLISLL